jgi:hypothetical protein
MSQTTHFRLGFDGFALSQHEMEINQLAPALLALSNILEEAAKQVSHGEGKASIRVRGNIKSGSIEIDLTVLTSLIENLTNFLSGNSVTAVLNGAELLNLIGLVGGGGAVGLIALIKKLKGKTPEKVTNNQDGSVTIIINNHTFIEDKRVVQLYQNIDIRKNLYALLQPLKEEGIDEIKAGETELHTIVQKDEVEYFLPPALNEILVLDNESQKAFTIVSLSFKEDNKWRLYDGQTTIHAELADPNFAQRVNNNEPFSKNDVLICLLRTQQWQTETGIRTEYTVQKVLEHRPSHRQIPLAGFE